MATVPKQVEADEEVIVYWKRQPRLSKNEIAALVIGVNPYAWDRHSNDFGKDYEKVLTPEQATAIEDVLTVIDHHQVLHDQDLPLKEWVWIFRECHLPFPDRLKPPLSKRTKDAVERLKDPEELARQLEKIEQQKGIPVLIAKWLRHDTWSADEAMLLLVGLDPVGTIIEVSESISGRKVQYVEIAYGLDAVESAPLSYLEEEGGDELRELQQLTAQWRNLWSLWSSGQHQPRNSPVYYLEWARSKGYAVPWLAWAEQNQLVAVSRPEEKSLSTKERTTLLVIISLLAKEAKIDLNKTSKAARIIAEMADCEGLQLAERTVEGHLKSISDALQRRKT